MFDSIGEIIGLSVLGIFVFVIILIYICKCYSDYTVGRFRDKQAGNPVSNDFGLALLGASDRNTSVDGHGTVGIDNDPFIDTEPIQGDHNDFSLVVESCARNSMRKQQHKTPTVPAVAAPNQSIEPAPEVPHMPMAALASSLAQQNEPVVNSKSIEVEVQVHNKDQYPTSYKTQPSIPFSPPTQPAAPPYVNLKKEKPASVSKHIEDPRRAFRNQSESSAASDPLDRQYPSDVPIQRYPSQNATVTSPIAPPKELYTPEPQEIPPQPVAKPPAPPARSEYMNLGVAKPLPHDYLNLAKKKPAPPTPPVPQKPEVPERVMSPAVKDKFNDQLSEALRQKEAAAVETPSAKTPRTPKKSRKVPDHLVSESKPKTPKSAKKTRKVPDDSFGLVTSPSQLKTRKPKPKPLPSEEVSKPLDDITNGQNTPTKPRSYKANINYTEQKSYPGGDQNGGDFIDSLCSPKSQHKPFVYNPDLAEFDYMLSPKLRRNDNAKNSDI